MDGSLKLLYVAPETLLREDEFGDRWFLDFLVTQANINHIVLDEAHATIEASQDFRPKYRQLGILKEYFPEVNITCLTATASVEDIEEIASTLQLSDNFNKIHHMLQRENLHHHVVRKSDEIAQLMGVITKHPKGTAGLVYCNTKDKCKVVSTYLNKNGYKSDFFYSTISKKEKARILQQFLDGTIDIVVSTTAFGTGINKPNCRFVVNLDIPSSMNDFAQQIGRSGRDGLDSQNYTLYSPIDVTKLQYILRMSISSPIRLQKATKKLNAIVDFCRDRSTCRSKLLLSHYGQTLAEDCGNCDNCKRQF